MEVSQIRGSICSSFHSGASDSHTIRSMHGDAENNVEDDEVELQWAAIERLPTFKRLRTSLFNLVEGQSMSMIDVTTLGAPERQDFINKLLTKVEDDHRYLLQKLRERIDRVGLELGTVEVRYHNLSIEAECLLVHGQPLPTLSNALKDIFSAMINITGSKSQANKIPILKDVSGIIKPSRLTLLLGPPGCGKTTLLQALSGKLDPSLKVTGEVLYNGYKFNEFVPQKTSTYISQHDLHISEMTVRETLDFSARCQGIGDRADIMKEISKREKEACIIPEPDIDTFMKAISIEGLKRSLQTDYILKILGLEICADTIVGDAMKRGISGGQKKRLTTGEMIIGPSRALFLDEISNGLDSSTTFQIVSCLQQLTHITDSTILISLLQPAPETFDLFDDIILMAEGKIVYHGPRSNVLEFFEHCGFRCPPRKGTADFLQEVVSEKDQAQYWFHRHVPHSYVCVDKFKNIFKEFHLGQKLTDGLSRPLDRYECYKNFLSLNNYSLKKWELFKACLAREWLLMKRNSFIYVFKTGQLVVIALITVTVFLRTQMKIDMFHADYYMTSLFYALIRHVCNGVEELSLTSSRLPVFYKQRDFYLYPAWTYSIPAVILKVPFSLTDAFVWTAITYYAIGYSPEPERFFRQFLLFFMVHQVSISLFRLIASIVRNPSFAAICALSSFLVMLLFGGFLLPQSSLPGWFGWGFWLSPFAYAEMAVSVNEFLSPRWQKISSSNTTIGHQILIEQGLNFNDYFYWISIGALLGFWIFLNIGFVCALTYLKSPGRSQVIISHDKLSYFTGVDNFNNTTKGKEFPSVSTIKGAVKTNTTGMVLPFEPLTLTFENVQYFVETFKNLRDQGFPQKRLQLLSDISGAFRPGILTALMGVSGAGKTTMMDVLSGRKTSGIIEGEIRVCGYPKVQNTYARVSGYCEQTDIHSPQITIEESVIYSAWLRLPSQIDRHTKTEFVAEVLQLIELDEIKEALVGIPGTSGISNEQRKRLTIAVELVSNPSIIFMDEPTSGLDARAAAVIMRAVKNIVHTNRTVVCTIHQPSIDIFEAFDELILMKRGGKIIYSGELGLNSSKLIEYFEGISGVPEIKENYNPATWMLEVTSPAAEGELGLDFAHLYKESLLFQKNMELIRELSLPAQGSKELHFSTRFAQNGWVQFKACLWKQHLTYWRSPNYNLARLALVIISSILLGAVLWQKGQKIDGGPDLLTILASSFILMLIIGGSNCSSVIPFIAAERIVIYREMFAGMYSSWMYSLAQVIIEIPYVFLQAVLFTAITYPTINFYWSFDKVFWYLYTMFCTLLFFSYFGMLLASVTPTYQVASVLATFSYTMFNLFSGYLIPGPKLPKWWIWSYWICPTAWSLKGILISHYGDITKEIAVHEEHKAVNAFLESYYGYRQDDLVIVGIVLIVFPLITATAFAFAMAKLNFQKR